MLEHCTLPRTGALEVIMDCLGPKSALSDHNSNNGSAVDKVSDLEPPLQQNGRTSQCSISDSGHDQVNKIVDVTIAYEQGKPLNLLNIITAVRPSCITHVHYRVFDVKQVRIILCQMFLAQNHSTFHLIRFFTYYSIVRTLLLR